MSTLLHKGKQYSQAVLRALVVQRLAHLQTGRKGAPLDQRPARTIGGGNVRVARLEVVMSGPFQQRNHELETMRLQRMQVPSQKTKFKRPQQNR